MTKPRNIRAEETRERIISVAAEEILHSGFQSSSISEIIKKAKVSKGCFYHHFPTKQELGYAVLEESFIKVKTDIWIPILSSPNSLQSIIEMFNSENSQIDCDEVKLGCPINNLAQEMSPIDEGFRKRIEAIYTNWKTELTHSLKQCQKNNFMKKDIDTNEIATLIMAVIQGAVGIAKNSQSTDSFFEYTYGLTQYLRTLQQNN